MKKCYYFGDPIGSRRGAVDSVITKIRSGWSKFRDVVPLLASGNLPLGAKHGLHSACVCSIMLYVSEVWTDKEEDVIDKGRMIQRWLDGCATLGLQMILFDENSCLPVF